MRSAACSSSCIQARLPALVHFRLWGALRTAGQAGLRGPLSERDKASGLHLSSQDSGLPEGGVGLLPVLSGLDSMQLKGDHSARTA